MNMKIDRSLSKLSIKFLCQQAYQCVTSQKEHGVTQAQLGEALGVAKLEARLIARYG